jgi:hypothetical protein
MALGLGVVVVACGKDIAGIDTQHLAGTWRITVNATVSPCFTGGYFEPIVLTVTQTGTVLSGVIDTAAVHCPDSVRYDMTSHLVLQGSVHGSAFTFVFLANGLPDTNAVFTAEPTPPAHGSMAWTCLPLSGTCAGPTPSGTWTATKQ